MSNRRMTQACLFILMALADRQRHGLGIAGEVERFSGGQVQLGPGILYGSIKRLLEKGFIEQPAGEGIPQDADPRRRYYRLTPRGRAALRSELSLQARILSAARSKKVLEEVS